MSPSPFTVSTASYLVFDDTVLIQKNQTHLAGKARPRLPYSILGLVNVVSGRIVVDDMDLAAVPGYVCCQRNLICLTQDPFWFSASVRSNLDPLNKSSDEAAACIVTMIIGRKMEASFNHIGLSSMHNHHGLLSMFNDMCSFKR